MIYARFRFAFSLCVLAVGLFLAACGGRSDETAFDAAGSDDVMSVGDSVASHDVCPGVTPCPSNAEWDPARCSCVPTDTPAPDASDAAVQSDVAEADAPDASPSLDGSADGATDGGFDAPSDGYTSDAPTEFDAFPPEDAAPDSTFEDAPFFDATFDATFDGSPIYCFDAGYCGAGYMLTGQCQCVACAQTCPIGQAPAAGCGACTACPYACPAGFADGPSCSCLPPGVDAGPPEAGPPDSSGPGPVTCNLQGYQNCPAGSWCELGVCPDNKTQYGCYCNADGTANCQVVCPAPPPCEVPGHGTCPYNATCAFDSCSNDPTATAFVCDCQSGGNVYCYSYPCSSLDGGIVFPFGDSGSPGPSCLLEGSTNCPVGQFCPLGYCQDGTQVGCTCNADGTATCQLVCPAPPPCTIPGEGTCPYGTSCTFGSCSTGALTCYCSSGGQASCYTTPCDAGLD